MAINPESGLNVFQLLTLLESLSQLAIGPNENTDDISQDLVVQFLKEGFQTIVDSETRWPWFETSYQTSISNLTNGGAGVIFNTDVVWTITSAYAPSPYVDFVNPVSMQNIKELINVISIQGTQPYANLGVELIYIGQHQAERYWIGSSNQQSIPGYFSLWSNSLYLWPRPNQIYTLQCRGYRQPNLTWLSQANQSNANSTDFVDLDNELQACLIAYTMSRIYQFQEDAEMSQVYMQQFSTNLKNYQDYLTAPSSNQPLVYSGGLQLRGNYWGGTGLSLFPSSGGIPLGVAW